MDALICLKEIEEPYIYHSLLYDSNKSTNTRYCVIAEHYFIIFKSCSDIFSLARIPLNLNTKIEKKDGEFTIISHMFRFTFTHSDHNVIKNWIECLETEIEKDFSEILTDFYAEEVDIDKIKNDCSILMDKNGYKLLIYESHEHHISDVVRHIVNLRFYDTKNIELLFNGSRGFYLIIKKSNQEIKMFFKKEDEAKIWQKILCLAIKRFSCCPSSIDTHDILTDEEIQNAENNNDPIFEGVFHLSYNNNDKMYNLFLVCLYKDKIIIKVENTNVLSKDNIIICSINLNHINLFLHHSSKDVFQLFINPQCKFNLIKNNSNEIVKIDTLSIYDPNTTLIIKLKNSIINCLIPNGLDPPSDETSLYAQVCVQINKENSAKCKCLIVGHKLIFSSPISMELDMTSSENISIFDNKSDISITFPNYDIFLQSYNNNLVLKSLEEASKIRVLSLKHEHTIQKLHYLINFITVHGLKTEGIFRWSGQLTKVDSLFSKLLDTQNQFSINPEQYSVHDATSCLKKCIPYLLEPLIPENLFINLKHACHKSDIYAIKKYLRSFLPKENHKVLLEIIELLFMIMQMSEFNKMTCGNICISVALSFISPKVEQLQESVAILQCFIENFFLIFDYSEEKQNVLWLFINGLKNEPPISILRTIHFSSSLNPFLIQVYSQMVEESKLKIGNESKFLSLSINVGDYVRVGELSSRIFQNISNVIISLWHFVFIKNKILKTLIYDNEKIDNSIKTWWKFSDTFCTSKVVDTFVFKENDKMEVTKFVGSIYQCTAKLKGTRNNVQLVLESPNSLTIVDDKLGSEIHNFKLSNINIYRIHSSTPTKKLYILYKDKCELDCEFENNGELSDFLLYFDKFRHVFVN